jgi:hypothetical protein
VKIDWLVSIEGKLKLKYWLWENIIKTAGVGTRAQHNQEKSENFVVSNFVVSYFTSFLYVCFLFCILNFIPSLAMKKEM